MRIRLLFFIYFQFHFFFDEVTKKITMNLPFFRVFTKRYFFDGITLNSLSIAWIYYKFVIFFANLLCIHYRFCEISMNSTSVSRKHFFREFTIIVLSFSKLTMNLLFVSLFVSLIYYGSIIFSWNHYKFNICFANSLSFVNSPLLYYLLVN